MIFENHLDQLGGKQSEVRIMTLILGHFRRPTMYIPSILKQGSKPYDPKFGINFIDNGMKWQRSKKKISPKRVS